MVTHVPLPGAGSTVCRVFAFSARDFRISAPNLPGTGHVVPFGRPTPSLPEKGDVPRAQIAQRLGLEIHEFETFIERLEKRGFPPPDPTTGRYCLEAVDRWRLRRH